MNFDNLTCIPDVLKPWMPRIVGVVIALVIIILGFIVAGWVASGVASVLRKRKVDSSLVGFLSSLARWLVVAAAIITALERVGLQTTSLVALLGSAGIAIGLALQGNLSHFASGVMVLLFRPFKVGDYIACAGYEGFVKDIGLFTTTLHTVDNELVIIANGGVTGGPLVNYSTNGSRRAHVDVGVDYGSKVPQVLEVLRGAAKRCDLVLQDPAPDVAFVGLGASSIDFVILAHCKPEEYAGMLHQVRTAAYEDLDKAGIGIPYPQIVVHQAKP